MSGLPSREAFFSRVRHAAAQGRRYRVKRREGIPADVGYVGGSPHPAEKLAQELEAAGTRAYRAASTRQVREIVQTVLRQSGARTALCWEHSLLRRCGIYELLGELEIPIMGLEGNVGAKTDGPRTNGLGTHSDAAPDQRFAADVGISSVDWAVAETGTLALCSGPGQLASVSLLPPVHIAIVEPAHIVPDLFDLFRLLQQGRAAGSVEATGGAAGSVGGMPQQFALITGPSKTGDIELKLTTGVHGPGEVHVIIVEAQYAPAGDVR